MARMVVWFLLGVWIIAMAAFGGACQQDDEKDEGNEDDSGPTPTPPPHTDVIEALAVGDAVYRYTKGIWVVEVNTPTDTLPWYSAAFLSRTEGWVGGVGVVMHYLGGTWEDETPDIESDLEVHRLAIGPDGRVWGVGNSSETEGGVFLMRDADGAWSATALEPIFGVDCLAKDIVTLADGSALVLVQADRSAVYYHVGIETPATVNIYTFDPANWLTFSAIGLTPTAGVMVGGRLNEGINKTGFLWLEGEGSVFAPVELSESDCILSDVTHISAPGLRAYMLGLCTHSVMYEFDGGAWSEIALPDEKGDLWRIHDFSFIDDETGWAVGYADQRGEALLLLRDPGGWQLVTSPEQGVGTTLYAVAAWPSDAAGDDDADDDTAADDTTTDDTAADDTTPEGVDDTAA